MKKSVFTLCFLLFWSASYSIYGQEELLSPTSFETLQSKSLELSRVGLYAESIEVIGQAIKFATENGLEEKAIMASIDLAEIMRKTEDFESGLNVLQNIQNSEAYPLQHVRLLDRSVAIIFEASLYSDEVRDDLVLSLLDSAITIAERNDYKLEEALLKNQKGYVLNKELYANEAVSYTVEAADIFLELNDTLNYLGAMTKALVVYGTVLMDTKKADSISSILLEEIKGKEWYTGEAELYGYMGYKNLIIKKDTSSYYKWEAKRNESLLKWKDQVSSREMDNFRVQQETLRFQQEADANALALEIEESRNQTLFTILAVLAFAILSIGILFYRERRLKQEMRKINSQLKTANEKYHVLMVESNHRIKNNLQMVISMLEFASNDVGPNNKKALKKISSKIHTVSLLHKHLYADIHNEFVSVEKYFEEIVGFNTDMSAGDLQVSTSYDNAEIRSERIIYFGLILNEMLANTIEHCKDTIKNVSLNISKNGQGYLFQYQDNSPWENQSKQGMGSLLIKQLINRIGGKDFTFDPNTGHFKFAFYAEG